MPVSLCTVSTELVCEGDRFYKAIYGTKKVELLSSGLIILRNPQAYRKHMSWQLLTSYITQTPPDPSCQTNSPIISCSRSRIIKTNPETLASAVAWYWQPRHVIVLLSQTSSCFIRVDCNYFTLLYFLAGTRPEIWGKTKSKDFNVK